MNSGSSEKLTEEGQAEEEVEKDEEEYEASLTNSVNKSEKPTEQGEAEDEEEEEEEEGRVWGEFGKYGEADRGAGSGGGGK